ncbi:MAG TPA: glycosyltransferase family 39 protein [Vicinamibacterales bacterium]
MTPRRWIVAIVVLAAALRLFPIWFGLPYSQTRPDEETAVAHAVAAHHWDLNPRFFHWPSLTFYLFALGYAVVATVKRAVGLHAMLSFAEHIVIGRVIVAMAGTLTVFVLYRIGRRMADETTGLVAALLLAVAILHVRDSHFAMTDVLMTCLVMLSLAALLVARDTRSLRWFAIAGLAGGLAASTKYSAVAVVAAMGMVQLQQFAGGARSWRPRAWTASAVFVLALMAGFLAATPYAILDRHTFLADFRYDLTHLSTGHADVDLGRGWLYHATHSLPYGAGLTIFGAAIPGLVVMLRRHTGHALVLVTFGAVFYAAFGGGLTVFFRYILPLIPLLCLAAAVAVRHAAPVLARLTGASPAAAFVALLAVVAAPPLVSVAWMDALLAKTDTRVLAGDWLNSQMRQGESLFDAGNAYTMLTVPSTTNVLKYDEETNRFNGDVALLPDWLVLQQSPLRAYARVPPALRALAATRYDLVHTVRATHGSAALAVYDPQDAFFLPFSRFDTVERPGPTIAIYRRR